MRQTGKNMLLAERLLKTAALIALQGRDEPRLPKPEGNGKLSRAESHALDREYRIQRNQALQLRNHREQMELGKARAS